MQEVLFIFSGMNCINSLWLREPVGLLQRVWHALEMTTSIWPIILEMQKNGPVDEHDWLWDNWSIYHKKQVWSCPARSCRQGGKNCTPEILNHNQTSTKTPPVKEDEEINYTIIQHEKHREDRSRTELTDDHFDKSWYLQELYGHDNRLLVPSCNWHLSILWQSVLLWCNG